MSIPDQDFDASGVSVANMSPEEIDAALAAIARETAAARSSLGKPKPAVPSSPELQQIIDSGGAAAPESPPQAESAFDASETPPAAARADPAVNDTETVLDNIDRDLAQLESLLAQTEGNNTSVPESIMQASSPESTPPEPPVSRSDSQVSVADANVEGNTVSETDSTTPHMGAESEPYAQPASSESSLYSDGGPGSTDATVQPDEAFAENAMPAAEVDSQLLKPDEPEESAWTLQSVLLMPLIIIDKPFARFSPRVKTAIGVAGAATLLVAIVTLLVSGLR